MTYHHCRFKVLRIVGGEPGDLDLASELRVSVIAPADRQFRDRSRYRVGIRRIREAMIVEPIDNPDAKFRVPASGECGSNAIIEVPD